MTARRSCGAPGLHAYYEVHAAYVGAHSFGYGNIAQVRQAKARLAFTYRVKYGLHGSVFYEQRASPLR